MATMEVDFSSKSITINTKQESLCNTEKIPLAADVKFNNSAPLEEITKSKKSRKRLIDENKQLIEEQYQKELHEQRYKRLMHLLNQSKFFSSYLLKKVESDITTKKKSASPSVNDENVSPNKKRLRRANREKYNMQDYISTEIREEVQHLERKKKKRLSEEDIAAELHKDSDSEIRKSAHNEVVALKYFRGELRDYQKDGLKWLKVLYKNGINGILADEMGLGKTIQVIAMMCHLVEKEQSGPYLIIAPLSTLPNWMMEFERFAPDIPTILFYGSPVEKKHLYGKIKTKYTVDGYKTQPVVITSYETPLKELNFFQNQRWRYIVIDEGQRIKNYNCALMKTLKSMQSMNRLILTGTPLQNNLAELWSLLNFLMPDIFDDLTVFESWFDVKELQHQKGTEKLLKQEEEKKVLMTLREILKPFMLRRAKTDVCLEIPPKKELVVYAPLTQLQHDLYRAVLNYDLRTLSKIEEPAIIPNIDNKRPQRKCVLRKKQKYVFEESSNITCDSSANSLLETDKEYHDDTKREVNCEDRQNLSMWKQYTDVTERNKNFLINIKLGNRVCLYKKIVNHPYLVHCPLDAVGLPKIDIDLIKSSGKLLVLDAMLAKLNARGHKVLLFSTMTMLLDIIEDYIMLRHYKYVRLDGRVQIEKRKEDIAAFNENPDLFLFLISTRAGGIGLNLAGADTVIIYDSDWNPQVDIQAMARCHRIGQTKPVVIYRLCTKGTIDEQIIKRAEAKRVLEKAIISKQILQNKDFFLTLKQLMNSKDYKVVTSENEVFTQEELEKLLDRSDIVDQMCK